MKNVVLDGKWTFGYEWKPTALTIIDTPSGSMYVRTAHQGDFIYILVDSAFDTRPIMGSDRATVCFDSDDNKSTISDSNDYCFVAVLGQNSTMILQGGDPLAITDNFKKILNHYDYVGVGGISSTYDVYGHVAHPSFEFKIPIELLGRSDSYGFFVQFYDASSKQFYSWPQDNEDKHYSHIPSPSKWGDIVSPDHTLPEFQFPMLLLIPAFLALIYFNRSGLRYFKNN